MSTNEKKTIIQAALLLSAVVMAPFAQAEFIPTDWKNTGDKLATLDTDTGLEWMDLTITDGKSINQVQTLINNGTYAGWRLPTSDEVWQMMQNFFPDLNVTGAAAASITLEFRQLFGQTGFNSSTNAVYSMGLFLSPDGSIGELGQAGAHSHASQRIYLSNNTVNNTTANTTWVDYGVFLVSDGGTTLSSINDPTLNINNPNAPVNAIPADVNISGFSGLSAFLLLGMTGWRRRKQHKNNQPYTYKY